MEKLIIITAILTCLIENSALAQADPKGIEYLREMQHDSSIMYLKRPQNPEEDDFIVASTIPAIDFAIQQGLDPWVISNIEGVYGGWGEITLGPDNCFYYAIGNHLDYGGNAYLMKYDPQQRIQEVILNTRDIAGWLPDDYADGKLHGRPDISPAGDIWMLSFFAGKPPDTIIAGNFYKGGALFYHNIQSGISEYLGQPVYGQSWPYHAWDWDRDILFAVNEDGNHILIYNTRSKEVLYHGIPNPEDTELFWYKRCVLLDRSTGKFYSNDTGCDPNGNPIYGSGRFICYDPMLKSATILNCTPPVSSDGKIYPTRAHTLGKDSEGAFWCADSKGGIFRFFPDADSTAFVDMNWGSGKYIGAIRFSPDKQFIYFICDALTKGDRYGTPVVQYDIANGKRKVLAFLRDFYVSEYGYNPGGSYGIEIDTTGRYLFFYANGKFTTGNSGYGRPSLFCVNIPESERTVSLTNIFNEIMPERNIMVAYPNPFKTRTSIEFFVNYGGESHITILNSMGEMVKSYEYSYLPEGKYFAEWDGEDLNGRPLPGGVYYIRLLQDKVQQTCRLILLR